MAAIASIARLFTGVLLALGRFAIGNRVLGIGVRNPRSLLATLDCVPHGHARPDQGNSPREDLKDVEASERQGSRAGLSGGGPAGSTRCGAGSSRCGARTAG